MSSSPLCLECEKIDFDNIFTKDPSKSIIQANVQYVSKLQGNWESGCPLCKFIERMTLSKPLTVGSRDELSLYLLGFKDYNSTRISSPKYPLKSRQCSVLSPALGVLWLSSQEAEYFKNEHVNQRKEPSFLARLKKDMRYSLSVTGYISGYPNPNDGQDLALRRVHRVRQAKVDFERIEHWLDRCRKTHNTCSDPPDGQGAPSHLINCTTLDIEENCEHSQYVALSYVWGTSATKETSTSLRFIWSKLPLTIKDAVHVTRKLGLQYLWVDNHCIPQNISSIESAVQKMGSIYNNASLVLIASSGNDALNGLPGVSTTARSFQPCVSIGKHTLVSSMMHPVERIRLSKWTTRGWTYQEERSAQRRLYFTEDQVYFECDSASCAEVDGETKEWPNYVATIEDETTGSFIESLNFVKSGSHRDHWSHVREASKRDLTNPNDVLDSILGVLRLPLAGQHETPGHLQGIPLREPIATRFPSASYFARQLCWSLEWSGTRRAGFPSWSWTGWMNCTVSPPANYNGPVLATPDDCSIQVSVESSASREHRQLQDLYRQNELDRSYNKPGTHVLRIATWVVEFRICLLERVNGRPQLPYSRVLRLSNNHLTTAPQSQKASAFEELKTHSAYYASIQTHKGVLYARFLPTLDLKDQHTSSRVCERPMFGLKLFHTLNRTRWKSCPDDRLCTPLLLLGVQSYGPQRSPLDLTTGVMERIGLVDLRELYELQDTELKPLALATSNIELIGQRATVRLG